MTRSERRILYPVSLAIRIVDGVNTRATMRLLATAILAMSILSVVQIADSSAKLRQRDDQIAQLISHFTNGNETPVSSAVPASDKH